MDSSTTIAILQFIVYFNIQHSTTMINMYIIRYRFLMTKPHRAIIVNQYNVLYNDVISRIYAVNGKFNIIRLFESCRQPLQHEAWIDLPMHCIVPCICYDITSRLVCLWSYMLIDHYPVICLCSYPQLIAHRSMHCIRPLALVGLYLLLGQHMTSRYYHIMCTVQTSKNFLVPNDNHT